MNIIPRIPSTRWSAVKQVVSADRRGFQIVLFGALCVGIANACYSLLLKWFTDSLASGAAVVAISSVGAYLLVSVAADFTREVVTLRAFTAEERADFSLRREIRSGLAVLPGMAHHETPALQNKVALAFSGVGDVSGTARATIDAIAICAQVALTLLLLASIHPFLLLVVLVAFPQAHLLRVAARIDDAADQQVAEKERLLGALSETLVARQSKELRLGGAGLVLEERAARLMDEVIAVRLRAAGKSAWCREGATLLVVLGTVSTLVATVRLYRSGDASLGDVAMATRLLFDLVGQFDALRSSVTSAVNLVIALNRFAWLRDAVDAGQSEASAQISLPTTLHEGITVTGVEFAYPGSDRLVLQDLSVSISPGSVVMLVGENGAGKSTFIKLLCGFYQPTNGAILVDGHSLDKVLCAVRNRLGVTFQDFTRPEFRLQETVALGRPERASAERVDRATSEAGLRRLIQGMPEGLQTRVGARFHAGQELSGGEWQLLARARGLMTHAPYLFLMDEATSALDPIAENESIRAQISLAKKLGEDHGTITIFVSHRLALAEQMDRIVVFDDGRLIEDGNHHELLRQGGAYARLWRQSQENYA